MRKNRRRRPYDATRRRERAAANVERVLAVAHRLFAERGYTGTTMAAIASEAGLATPTLYAVFGSKRGILSRLLGRLVSGEPGSPNILTTAQARAVFAESNPRRALDKFAQHMDGIQERVGGIYDVMKSAARTDADAAKLYIGAQKSRFKNLQALASHLAEHDSLRSGLTEEDAGRTLWVLASPEVRQMLLAYAGWSRERYTHWLADTLHVALLRPDGARKSDNSRR